MLKTNLISLYQESFRKHWDSSAISNYEGSHYTTGELATEITKLHLIFEQCALQKGDKIAVMGKDTAEWVIAFMATITYGCIVVPVLKDFSPQDATSILNHSESKFLFIDTDLWSNLRPSELSSLQQACTIQERKSLFSQEGAADLEQLFAQLDKTFETRYPKGYSREDIAYYQTPNDQLILLNYTSGTTGFSKGVMVTGNNIAGNVLWCIENKIIHVGDKLLSFLPLAHTYGCMINVLLALTTGVHVTFLGKMPTPRILSAAFKSIRPNVIISVPLILEKIYTGSIAPQLRDPKIKFMLAIPGLRNLIYKKIRNKLLEGMGGAARLVIVGGAALNPEIGAFLKKIKFPLSVGYGMTECAPLISFTPDSEKWRLGSCGQTLKNYMEVRIAPAFDESGELIQQKDEHGNTIGEIQTRGENTCLGYYKNEEQTQALFTEDGWLRTGDLGTIDKAGFIYIKGRSKTMLLSGNGQNIYPEEIEAKISLLPHVLECLVLMRKGHLEALVVLNPQSIEAAGISEEEAWQSILEGRKEVNMQLANYEQIQSFELHPEPFVKTPKQSIKRFLYK